MFTAISRFWQTISDSCKYLGASLAIMMVKRKLRRRPHDWTLWLTLARLYEVGYQWSQAIDSLEHARQLSPNNEVITRELARIKEEAKQDSRHTRSREGDVT